MKHIADIKHTYRIVGKREARNELIQRAERLTGDKNVWRRLNMPHYLPEAWIAQFLNDAEKMEGKWPAIMFNSWVKKAQYGDKGKQE